MGFGVVDEAASYGIPSYKNSAVQQADLAMLLSTGAQCVRLDIGYAPWLTNNKATISLVTSVVNSIRSAGKCLIIADAGSESYRGTGELTWAQFIAAWPQRVSTLAALYHPDYYIVVKEPGWYVPMVSDSTTNPAFQSASSWLSLTQTLASAVQKASPKTVVGVAVGADDIKNQPAFYSAYLNGVQGMVGFIGFDIYDTIGQTATTNYLTANSPKTAVWIAETWSNPNPTTSAQAQSDAAWMKSIYQYGQQIGARMLIPFYTDLFSGYTVPTTTSSLTAFYSGRTPVFTEFKNVVAGKP
jgi:hypothetical protein